MKVIRGLLALLAVLSAHCFVVKNSKVCSYQRVKLASLFSKLNFTTPDKEPGLASAPITERKFELIKLPYELHELSPDISHETVKFHYLKHHQGYVNKLNELGNVYPHIFNYSLEDLIKAEKKDSHLYNMACQVWNHDFYWLGLDPRSTGRPSQLLEDLMTESFGSFDKFKEEFTKASTGHFGSGWVWLLYYDYKPHLRIVETHDADNPLKLYNIKPLLVLDVWEHAYYIDYKNDRKSYVNGWFNKVNWNRVDDLVRERISRSGAHV